MGSGWQKILLLMVVYNGRAAVIAGNVVGSTWHDTLLFRHLTIV